MMVGNWSIILNVLLLIGVMIAIGRTIYSKREKERTQYTPPLVGQFDSMPCDDIIAVRKVNRDVSIEPPTISPSVSTFAEERNPIRPQEANQDAVSSLMFFLLAKEDRQLGGYELLQTLLTAGLRFGEGQIFHRHQHANGHGPVLCSVAAATSTGMFDLQNIGAFSVHGLCIFMEASGSPTIDQERFSIMLEMAKQLSEDLDAYLLDDRRQPLTDTAVLRYHRLLHIDALPEKETI
jgi:cell division protein ZipA